MHSPSGSVRNFPQFLATSASKGRAYTISTSRQTLPCSPAFAMDEDAAAWAPPLSCKDSHQPSPTPPTTSNTSSTSSTSNNINSNRNSTATAQQQQQQQQQHQAKEHFRGILEDDVGTWQRDGWQAWGRGKQQSSSTQQQREQPPAANPPRFHTHTHISLAPFSAGSPHGLDGHFAQPATQWAKPTTKKNGPLPLHFSPLLQVAYIFHILSRYPLALGGFFDKAFSLSTSLSPLSFKMVRKDSSSDRLAREQIRGPRLPLGFT